MTEIWKDVVGYECLYQVSNLGRIKSVFRNINHKPYNITIKERIIKQTMDRKGYYYVNLSKQGKVKCCRVHQLVGKAFIPNPNNLVEINHINGIKTCNIVDNLEWVSHKENMQHARKNGLFSQDGIMRSVNAMIKEHKRKSGN